MNNDDYWNLIESARRAADANVTKVVEKLRNQLSRASDEEVIAFKDITKEMVQGAYSRKLWLAFDFLHGQHLSDDAFEYSIGGLICLGKKTYESVVGEPDSVSDFDEFESSEEFLGLTFDIWRNRHPNTFIPKSGKPLVLFDEPETEAAIEELNKNLPSLYPKLFAKYGLPKQAEFDPMQDPYAF